MFKGLVPRLFTRGPQFGVTLLSYEVLQSLIIGEVNSERRFDERKKEEETTKT